MKKKEILEKLEKGIITYDEVKDFLVQSATYDLGNILFSTFKNVDNDEAKVAVNKFYEENKDKVIRSILYFGHSDDEDIGLMKKCIDSILEQNQCEFSSFQDIIRANPQIILESFRIDQGLAIARLLMDDEEYRRYKEDNITTIWKKINTEKSISDEENNRISNMVIKEWFDTDNLDFLNKNIDEIIQNTNNKNIMNIYVQYVRTREQKKILYLNRDMKTIINKFYNEYKKEFTKYMMIDILGNEKSDDIDNYTETLAELLDSLMEEQGCQFVDIEVIGKGGYSNVFAIGERILKIGKPRETYNIPNHRRILQPFIRENFEDSEGNPFACIEISQRVRNIDMMNINYLYDIYKELRESGILWGDVKEMNLGILQQRNLPKYKGEHFEQNPEFVGIEGELDKEDVLDAR